MSGVNEIIQCYKKKYRENKNLIFSPVIQELHAKAVADKRNPYEVYLTFVEAIVPTLYEHYTTEGIPLEIAEDSVKDIACKTRECEQLYGIKGIFVPEWFEGFFQMKRFALGRLQFELFPVPSNYPYVKGCDEIPAVINVHIPSMGKLDHDECIRSYQMAEEFFHKYFGMRDLYFYCDSWMLNPAHERFLPPNSNILKFMRDYQIYEEAVDKENRDLWRIFHVQRCDDFRLLPEDTSLQKAYKNWLLSGHSFVCGKGAYRAKETADACLREGLL